MIKIPIIMSSDNNIIFTAGAALTSLLENASKDTFYEIKFLHSADVTEENKNKLLQLEEKYLNVSIEMFDMGDKFKNIPTTQGYHVNYVSAYKMCVAQMFPQYDKVLYLDTDIIVRDDLQEFYNFDIGGNYIAGTPVLTNIILRYKYIIDLLNIQSVDYYINAGVMLMNLKKIREDKIDEKWISLLGSYEGSVDQHILNKVCYGKTINIPQKFNVCLSELKFFKREEINIFYSPKEVNEAYNNPVIFHWTGKEKPWLFCDTWYAQEWLMYFNKSPFGAFINRERCFICTEKILKKRKEKNYLFGIPIFKVKYAENCEYGFLFSLLKIYKKKIWKGNVK